MRTHFPIKTPVIIIAIGLMCVIGGMLLASIRMVPDPQPAQYIYKLKEMHTGVVSSKWVDAGDPEYDYEVGDMFEQGDTVAHFTYEPITRVQRFIILKKRPLK